MLKSRTVTINIARSPDDVFNFLLDPTNLSRWTMVKNGRQLPDVGPYSWAFDGPRGSVVVHFSPPNPLFVLDYRMQMGPQIVHAAAMRVIRNGAGCVLTHTSVQQPLVSDAVFASEEEWMNSDLMVLKTLLEG